MQNNDKNTIELTEKQRQFFLGCDRQIQSVQDMMRGGMQMILAEHDALQPNWTLSQDRSRLVLPTSVAIPNGKQEA